MNDELDATFLNLEFRIMLFEESCKELEERLITLKTALDRLQADLLSSRDEDYWRADD
jgi:hypothetical protein